jgi:hypothetical protein
MSYVFLTAFSMRTGWVPVSIVTAYGLGCRGSIPDRGRGFLLYPLRPDRLWGPPSLLYRGSPQGGKCGRGLLLNTHPLLVPWVRKERDYTSSPPVRPNWRVTGNLYIYLFFFFMRGPVAWSAIPHQSWFYNCNNITVHFLTSLITQFFSFVH